MKSFEYIWTKRPDKKGKGSSNYSNLRNLYDICTELQPELIVESGSWKGNSSWLFSHFADVVCHDIDFSNLMWESPNITYIQEDISFFSYPKETLFLFDDHISHVKRLEWMINGGYKYAIFDDNQNSLVCETLKNPPSPTLEQLYEVNQEITNRIKVYRVMPELAGQFDTRLTYLEI